MISGGHHIWSGDDWQAYCDGLFREKHGSTGYVRVPDRDRGDLGMEGYSIDGAATVYQCYATEAVDVGKRYEKQRDKITKDLGKLVANKDRVADLLGAHIMKFWVLMVPLHDSKELVMHARAKDQEIREKDLPFLDDDFTVLIWTDEDFAKERVALDHAGVATIPPPKALTEADVSESVAAMKDAARSKVEAMSAKLGRAGVAIDVAELRERLLRQIVEADNIREHLRREFPSTSERVLTELGIEERAIIEERDFNQLHADSVVAVRRRFNDRLTAAVPAIGADQASRMAHGAVGRWLLECPLDFPEPDDCG